MHGQFVVVELGWVGTAAVEPMVAKVEPTPIMPACPNGPNSSQRHANSGPRVRRMQYLQSLDVSGRA
eukprot:COSAG05_NODE_407_length_10145_cov_234.042604_10_plen_67_part_00